MNLPKTGLLAILMFVVALAANFAEGKTETGEALHFTMLFSNNVTAETEPCG